MRLVHIALGTAFVASLITALVATSVQCFEFINHDAHATYELKMLGYAFVVPEKLNLFSLPLLFGLAWLAAWMGTHCAPYWHRCAACPQGDERSCRNGPRRFIRYAGGGVVSGAFLALAANTLEASIHVPTVMLLDPYVMLYGFFGVAIATYFLGTMLVYDDGHTLEVANATLLGALLPLGFLTALHMGFAAGIAALALVMMVWIGSILLAFLYSGARRIAYAFLKKKSPSA